jgi:hypothetical protein
MQTLIPTRGPRALLRTWLALLLLSTLAACQHTGEAQKRMPQGKEARTQLSIGYSLLYQEADGIPKLKWLLMFKEKHEEMSRTTNGLIEYYQQLAATLERLSKQYPAVRLDVTPMSDLEADTRKGIGEDMAKDMAPVAGRSGQAFEREALLMFYNGLNEQRHLVAEMLKLETDSGLHKFLETTKSQLDERYNAIGTLLERRYFTR